MNQQILLSIIKNIKNKDLKESDWEILKQRNPSWNEVDLRDNRYDQIIHMVTAALGAEQYYLLDNNLTRTETIDIARKVDERCAKAWIGHPYFDVIDNYTVFEMKIARVLHVIFYFYFFYLFFYQKFFEI